MRRTSVLSVLSVLGASMSVVGLVLLLLAGYEVYGTTWATVREQHERTADLDRQWSAQPEVVDGAPAPGRPFTRIYVPALGSDYVRTVLEGVDGGHALGRAGAHPGTALPGTAGNAAVAGHRGGHGGPFGAADELRSCDAIVFETRDHWFVYRVLPMACERADWVQRSGSQASCQGVQPLDSPYGDTVGQEVVAPSQTEVIAPVPHHPELAPSPAVSLVTLTTCYPRYSARERLIIHGVLGGGLREGVGTP